jgi:hypothetical protein
VCVVNDSMMGREVGVASAVIAFNSHPPLHAPSSSRLLHTPNHDLRDNGTPCLMNPLPAVQEGWTVTGIEARGPVVTEVMVGCV